MTWRYTDERRAVVHRVNEDGSGESYLVTVPAIQAWIAEGNTPLEPEAAGPPKVEP